MMNIISPEYFFNYLITNSDISLDANNSYLDDAGKLKHKFALRVVYNEDDFIENMINTHNTITDDNEEAFGQFSYLGTNIDDSSQFPVYSEVFKLEIYAYEKYRNEFIQMMEEYAVGINKYKTEVNINDKNHTLFIVLGENSTPYYGPKEDINGAEMFKVSLTIICNVYEEVILSNNMVIKYINNSGIEEEIPYITMNIKRDRELSADNRPGYEKTYLVNKSDLTISLGAFYTNSDFSKNMMSCVLDETALSYEFTIMFEDKTLNKSFIYRLIPVSINPTYTYGTPIMYTAIFKKKRE